MKIISPLLRTKWVLAVISAGVIGSGAYAFAATLGTTSATLGAGNTTVSSCSASVKATYTTAFSASTTPGNYAVNSVSLVFPSNTCAQNDKIEVVLQDGSSAALASFVYTIGASDVVSGGGTVVVDAGSSSPAAGTGTLSHVTGDGTDFTTGTPDVPAASVNGIAISAVGA